MRDHNFPRYLNLAFYPPLTCEPIRGDQPIDPPNLLNCSIYVRCEESERAVIKKHNQTIYPEDFNATHVPLIQATLQAVADKTHALIRARERIDISEDGTTLLTRSIQDARRLLEGLLEFNFPGPDRFRESQALLSQAIERVINGTSPMDDVRDVMRYSQRIQPRRAGIPTARTAAQRFYFDFIGDPMPEGEGMNAREAEDAYQYFFREIKRRMTPEFQYFNIIEDASRWLVKLKRAFTPEGAREMFRHIEFMNNGSFGQLLDAVQSIGVTAEQATRSMDTFSRIVNENMRMTFRRNLLGHGRIGHNGSDWWVAIQVGAPALYADTDLDYKIRMEHVVRMEDSKQKLTLRKMEDRLENKYRLPPLLEHKESTIVPGKSEAVAGYLHMNKQFKTFIDDLTDLNHWSPEGKEKEERPKAKFHKFLNPM